MVVIHKKKILKVGLLGNPNTGKTTLFNRLTGSAQYVGNWPGVTVEKKEGFVKNTSIPIKLTDLPGVYSLSPFSPEEVITRNYILDGNSDLIINILDATNLERNLYLTTQILELGNQVIIALNMSDMIERTGKIIDFCEMEKILGIPVIPISASKNIGINELVEKILKFEENKISNILKYDDEIENKLSKINKILKKNKNKITDNRFVLVKILEFDPIIISSLKLDFKSIEEIDKIRGPRKEIKYEEMITEARYNKSRFICQKVVSEISKIKKAKISRRIDKVVTGRYSAIPIFFVIILSVFHLSFGPIGSSFQKFTKLIIERGIASPVKILLTQISVNKIIESFIGAMISGLGEVISFMPQILLLLGLLSLLDDSGYMARAAFVMDRIMRKIGLSGKAFVPLLMGFGCSVPAILSTRILKSR
ncbi:MAG: ferrous iron transport protein B, partial [Firmicutes bacterium]|nr:ferrous iron transport protein B [Bacillota bacterium]